MAQVLLPCFLPSWTSVKQKIEAIQGCLTVDDVIQLMTEIHDLCNVGLDPEEIELDRPLAGVADEHLFAGLHSFLTDNCDAEERQHYVTVTMKRIADLAVRVKELRPPTGLKFALQQQATTTELNRNFVASALANAFLSTFPNRNINTHPTLQNFNFSYFFRGLRDRWIFSSPSGTILLREIFHLVEFTFSRLQMAKLRSWLRYFDWIWERARQNPTPDDTPLRICRKVMTGKQWLTIEDWNECNIPLSPVEIRHDNKIESSPYDVMQILFVNPRIGGEVLGQELTTTRESVQFATCPELLITLLFTEALEDNESLFVENLFQVSRILAPKQKAFYESLESPRLVNVGCMDAECYSHLVIDQFEEDNFLRELNKCLLTFLPNINELTTVQDFMKDRRVRRVPDAVPVRRLSPIGERMRKNQIIVNEASSSTAGTCSVDTDSELVIQERPSWLSVKQVTHNVPKFIVLGSSGECLPVNRQPKRSESVDLYSSCENSSEASEEFHSARESVEDPEEGEPAETYLNKLYSPDKRYDFARRLRNALCEHSVESVRTDSTDDGDGSIVGGAVKGNDVHDRDRGSDISDGFVLQDSSFDEDILQELILQETGACGHGNSSKYSFSTDLSSELSEFAQLSQDELDKIPEMDMRDKAVFHFASSILKRGLSESIVGCGEFPTSEQDNKFFPTEHPHHRCDLNNNNDQLEKDEKVNSERVYNNTRSLSVEFVKQKHLLAAKLIKDILQKRTKKNGEKVLGRVATGNWGCGQQGGDVQLKFILQWMAASLSGSKLIYHTAGVEKLSRLDTICRILIDRKWSVGRLSRCTLKSNQYFLENPVQFVVDGTDDKDFFDRLLGIDRGK